MSARSFFISSVQCLTVLMVCACVSKPSEYAAKSRAGAEQQAIQSRAEAPSFPRAEPRRAPSEPGGPPFARPRKPEPFPEQPMSAPLPFRMKRLSGGPDAQEEFNTEAYDAIAENRFLSVQSSPQSTFSIDVDTASYSNVRRFLNQGRLPPPGAVRTEELINYFSYDYPEPTGSEPFSVTTELAPAPWDPRHQLAQIGIQGKRISTRDLPPRNLVFLLDVSGSMSSSNKLPLLKRSMAALVETLNARDRVAIVVYAGASGLVLPSTPGNDTRTILDALQRLQSGGSTNGGAGIELAYGVAREHAVDGGVNRVILATDGDFNVGITNQSELLRRIESERQSGVYLTVLGFGMGNYKDSTLEKLADKGNGNYAYIDSYSEARKVLVEQGGGTLVTLAKDVKIQVEFNPSFVGAYRLIGYENRKLNNEDFKDDSKDAGEIGAGHSVTALYELVPPELAASLVGSDGLKYQTLAPAIGAGARYRDELMTVSLRYKQPDSSASQQLDYPVASSQVQFVPNCQSQATCVSGGSNNFRFAASLAAFGMMLHDSEYRGGADYGLVKRLAGSALGEDRSGRRKEFLQLVERAAALASR
jgi:Ca-activated chloride channel homolog